jgi:probable rRNA maturation factor
MSAMKHNINIEVIDSYKQKKFTPSISELKLWIAASLVNSYTKTDINLVLTNAIEMENLNISFRSKSGPTNVLSFTECNDNNLAGDIIICSPLVQTEAKELKITESHHFTHLFIHGVLHLQGYDHINEDDAVLMEGIEKNILESIFNGKQE